MIGVYKIENKINGMKYVGATENIEHRWVEHKRNNNSCAVYLQEALKEYGIENFDFEILEECSKNELPYKERYWIEELNTMHPNGYNGDNGGNYRITGHKMSEISKQKMRDAKLGKIKVNDGKKDKLIEEYELQEYLDKGYVQGTVQDLSGENNPMYGVHLTGEKHWAYGRRGKDSPNYGKKYNVTYKPYKWMNKDGVNKQVKLDDIEKYLSNGWNYGLSKESKERMSKSKKRKIN